MERNPVRAGLLEQAEQWRWSSAETHGSVPVHDWPIERPADWLHEVNEGETAEQLSAVRKSVTERTTVRQCVVGGADGDVVELGRNIASTRAAEEGAGKQWFLVSLGL